jgi:hypothetical protein
LVLDFHACDWESRSLLVKNKFISIGIVNISWILILVCECRFHTERNLVDGTLKFLTFSNTYCWVLISISCTLYKAIRADVVSIWTNCILEVLGNSIDLRRHSTNILSKGSVLLNSCGRLNDITVVVFVWVFGSCLVSIPRFYKGIASVPSTPV